MTERKTDMEIGREGLEVRVVVTPSLARRESNLSGLKLGSTRFSTDVAIEINTGMGEAYEEFREYLRSAGIGEEELGSYELVFRERPQKDDSQTQSGKTTEEVRKLLIRRPGYSSVSVISKLG